MTSQLYIHWNITMVIRFTTVTAPEAVMLPTFSAVDGGNFINQMHSHFSISTCKIQQKWLCYVLFIPLPNEVGGGGGGGGILCSPCLSVHLSVRPSVCRRHGFWSVTRKKFALEFQFQISYVHSVWSWSESFIFSMMSLSKCWPGSHIGFFGFQTLILVCLWISSPNFNGTSIVYMERSLLVLSNIIFRMATWHPYWIFQVLDSNFSLALNIKSKLVYSIFWYTV